MVISNAQPAPKAANAMMLYAADGICGWTAAVSSLRSAIVTIGVVFVQLAVELAKTTFSKEGHWDAAAEASSVMFCILPVAGFIEDRRSLPCPCSLSW